MSVVVACKPMWQNLRAYQPVTNNPCPHINAELLLVSTQYSFSHNSQINCFRTRVHMDFLLVLVYALLPTVFGTPVGYTL
jgi:hypothetical protein